MRAFPRLVVALGCAAAGCSQLQPFVTMPAAKPEKAVETGSRIGICYDPLLSNEAKVLELATSECGPGATAQKVDTDYKIMACPVLLPARGTFLCTPKNPK